MLDKLPVLPMSILGIAGYVIYFLITHGIIASLSILVR